MYDDGRWRLVFNSTLSTASNTPTRPRSMQQPLSSFQHHRTLTPHPFHKHEAKSAGRLGSVPAPWPLSSVEAVTAAALHTDLEMPARQQSAALLPQPSALSIHHSARLQSPPHQINPRHPQPPSHHMLPSQHPPSPSCPPRPLTPTHWPLHWPLTVGPAMCCCCTARLATGRRSWHVAFYAPTLG